jgi:DNA-binding transcriptional regulator YhcF (GntR family)
MDNKKQGWIGLYRSTQKHWLYPNNREFTKYEAWIDILLSVNHSEQKVNIGNLLLTVKRGESIMSLDSWATKWKWNKSKVRRFFEMLIKDKMIVTKNEKKTTRLTVCKYDSYQDFRNDDETQVKRKRNASETQATPNNNDNNNNNANNENKQKKKEVFNFRKELISLGGKEDLVIDWLKVRLKRNATNSQTAFNLFNGQVNKSNLNINEILLLCISKDWKAFNSSWVDVKKQNHNNQGNTPSGILL